MREEARKAVRPDVTRTDFVPVMSLLVGVLLVVAVVLVALAIFGVEVTR